MENSGITNQPISEQYRLAALEWVDADAAANLLEDTRSIYFSELVNAQSPIAVNKAEHNVKASPIWRDYVTKTVNARTRANKLKVQVDFMKMKFWEHNSSEASKRAEMKL